MDYKDTRLLIVDDDRNLCDALQETFLGWGIETKAMTRPNAVISHMNKTCYNTVLLDIVMPGKSGFDLIPEIQELCPDTKIIIMTGYADKEKAVTAIRLGVFDFLEKPINMTVLSHAVKRAMHTHMMEEELKKTVRELEHSQGECLAYGHRLEDINEQLLETNKALSVLAENLERTREESEKRIVLKIRSLIVPIVEKLQGDKALSRYEADLSTLMGHIEDLTSGLGRDTRIAGNLSSTELRIASMIMNELTSQEIANQLHISLSTVKTHRKNIRRKLNIQHSGQGLRSFLEANLRKRRAVH
ncbi:MAG: response regulator [Deltaproteobacteria bacterium]|nr:response regulator [Deltaproteobacteria bacterium]